MFFAAPANYFSLLITDYVTGLFFPVFTVFFLKGKSFFNWQSCFGISPDETSSLFRLDYFIWSNEFTGTELVSVAVALFVCDLKLARRSHTLTTKETNEIIYFTVLYF